VTWQFAAATACCADRPVVSTIEAFHRASITAVELGTPPGHFDPWSHADVRALRTRLRQLSMTAISIHAPFGGLLDLTDPNPHHRHAAVGAILSAATAVREVGGARVIVHLSDVPREGQDVEARLARAADALNLLARALDQMSVTLAVETPLPHLIGGDPKEFASVVKRLPPTVGACFDTAHTTLGRHWDAFMQSVGSRLIHVHASDHRGQRDDHLPPGVGIIDWHHIRGSLAAIRFTGWIVLEVGCPNETMTPYIESAMRRTQALFGDSPAG
jgi:sugar phosphate isomerase/epimerase